MATSVRARDGASDEQQNRADKTGLAHISFESSWWGDEKLGEWQSDWWALIDHETDDALHLAFVRPNARRTVSPTSDVHRDVWVPKSKVDVVSRPDWDVYSPTHQPNGVVYATQVRRSSYGPKMLLFGDTYDACHEEELLDGLWEDEHPTFNGEQWEVDSPVSDSVVEALVDGGYEVRVAPWVGGDN